MEACCTCATLLTNVPRHSSYTEKPLPSDRHLECCPRIICGNCLHKNERFTSYCPFCQISVTPSTLPQGLKEPPSYTSLPTSSKFPLAPPPYSASTTKVKTLDPLDEKSVPLDDDEPPAEDTLHFLNHQHDSVTSLSLRYNVPAAVLRRANNITSDHLLLGRRTVVIPGEFYRGGVSLSPRPVEGEEEELRKGKIRRFMVGCKVAEYDVAVLYLDQMGYDLEAAMEAFVADEQWEKSHPVDGKSGKRASKGEDFGRTRGFLTRRGR